MSQVCGRVLIEGLIEVRDAVKNPAMPPTSKNYPVQNVDSAKVEKL